MAGNRVNVTRLVVRAVKSGRDEFLREFRHSVLVPHAVQRGALQDSSSAGSTLLHLPNFSGDLSLLLDPRVLLLTRDHEEREASILTVGRTLETDISLSDHSVGLKHARFQRAASGGWTLQDLGSKNGTYVDGLRLIPGVPLPVESKQQVLFGRVLLHFYSPEDLFEVLMASGSS